MDDPWHISREQVEALLTAGWTLGWRPPWEPGCALLDSHSALAAATAADQHALDTLTHAATGDGYVPPVTVPDTLPAHW